MTEPTTSQQGYKITDLKDIRQGNAFNSKVQIQSVQESKGKRDNIIIYEGFCSDKTKYLPFRVTTTKQYEVKLEEGKSYEFKNYQAEIYGRLLKLNLRQPYSQIKLLNETIPECVIDYQPTDIKTIGEDIANNITKGKHYNVFAVIGEVREVKAEEKKIEKQGQEQGQGQGQEQGQAQEVDNKEKKDQNKKQTRRRSFLEGWCADKTGKINFRVEKKSEQLCQVGQTVLFAEASVIYHDNEIPKIIARVLPTNQKIDDNQRNTNNNISEPTENTRYKRTEISKLELGQNGDNVEAFIISAERTQQQIQPKRGPSRKIDIVKGQCGDSTGVINYLVKGKYAESIKEGEVVLFVNIRSEIDNDAETHRIFSGRRGRIIKIEKPKLQLEQVNKNNDKSIQKWQKIVVDANKQQPQRRNNRSRRSDNNRPNGNRRQQQQQPRERQFNQNGSQSFDRDRPSQSNGGYRSNNSNNYPRRTPTDNDNRGRYNSNNRPQNRSPRSRSPQNQNQSFQSQRPRQGTQRPRDQYDNRRYNNSQRSGGQYDNRGSDNRGSDNRGSDNRGSDNRGSDNSQRSRGQHDGRRPNNNQRSYGRNYDGARGPSSSN